MTVVQYETPPPLPPSRPGDELEAGPVGRVARLRAAAEYAAHIAHTEFVPEAMRGNVPTVTAALLAGEEVGLEPMATLRLVAVIRGTPTFKAEALRAMIAARGHELWLEESTATRCIIAGRRAGEERVGRVTWTMDDAKRAGLAGQHNYRTYPREMLVARATAALARQMFADVVAGLVAYEELEEQPGNGIAPATPELSPPADVEQQPTTRRRRRPSASSSPAPATGPEPAAPERDDPAATPGSSRTLEQDPSSTPERPAVPPTPPPDEQPQPLADPEMPNRAQLGLLFALFNEKGMRERDDRLAWSVKTLGRPVASSTELTSADVSRLIEELRAIDAPAPPAPAPPAPPGPDDPTPEEQAVLDELTSELGPTEVDPPADGEPGGFPPGF